MGCIPFDPQADPHAEHHTFGKDAELGEADVDVWRHIQPAVPNADVWVELKNGTGLLRLRLDWNTSSTPAGATERKFLRRSPSISSKLQGSPGRFGFSALTPTKKDKDKERESVDATSS